MLWKIITLIVIFSICSSIDGRRLSLNIDDDDVEITHEKAQMFLRSILNDDSNNNEQSFDKRESGTNCVRCKFKINNCCAPNICIRKLFWNECMEIKTGGKGK